MYLLFLLQIFKRFRAGKISVFAVVVANDIEWGNEV